MIKTLQKMGTDGTYLNTVKAIYDKPTVNIILNGEKLKAFPLRSGKRQGSPLLYYYSTQLWKSQLQQSEKKRNKRNPDQKRCKALTVCRCIIPYIENPKDSIRKSLELISEFSKVAAYKFNTQKSLAFLYINNKKSER